MKYTIELTNKQKAQMDCMMEIVHRYVGFNPKLEPIKTTNVEDTSEYQIGYKVGFEDGKKQAIEEIPELANKENKIYNDGYNKGLEDGKANAIYNTDLIDELKQVEYIRGLEDAWKLARKIEMLTCGEVRDIFGEKALTQFGDEEPSVFAIINQFSYQESESMIKAYEEKKKAKAEIRVGDEVIITGLKDQETIGVITMLANNNYTVICLINGSEMARVTKNDIKPTGRHFGEVEQIIDKLRCEEK